jgi:hypothetical protein
MPKTRPAITTLEGPDDTILGILFPGDTGLPGPLRDASVTIISEAISGLLMRVEPTDIEVVRKIGEDIGQLADADRESAADNSSSDWTMKSKCDRSISGAAQSIGSKT